MGVTLYGDRICGGGATLNLINYMLHGFRGKAFHDSAFVGFYPLIGSYTNWGIVLDDTPCCGVHLFRTDPDWHWGDDPKDTPENSTANPWVLMFYGNDNSSCFLRFPERQNGIDWLARHSGVDFHADGMIYYNS